MQTNTNLMCFFLENGSEVLVVLFFLFTFAVLFHQKTDLYSLYFSVYEVIIGIFPYYINKVKAHLLSSNSILPDTCLFAFATSSVPKADK